MTRSLTLRAIRERSLLELDQFLWWRQTSALRRRTDFPPPEMRLLVSNAMASIGAVKSEALFAAALRSRGFALTVLLPGRYSIIERYYQATGPVKFVYLDSLLDDDIRRDARKTAERTLREDPDYTSLFSWAPDGYRIGRNVLSKALRLLRVGRIDPVDAHHRQVVCETLAESLATKQACERLLEHLQPDTALFNERGYTPAAEIFDGCLLHGVDCIQWFGAPQSDSLAYKRYRPETRDRHPLSLADETWAALKRQPWNEADERGVMEFLRSNYESGAWFNRQQLQEGKPILAPDVVASRLGLDPSKKTAVIFSHILYDATFFYGKSLFPDYETWLVEATRCAVANPNLNWVIKVHPVNVWRSRMDDSPMEQLEATAIAGAIGPLPEHVKILPADTDINTYALFSLTDYGLTVRGTVGMELPCFGIPVVTAGTGRYSGRGFTTDPESPAAFQQTLARLHEIPPLDDTTIRLARLYTYGSFFLRPLQMQGFALDFNANTFGLSALTGNVRLNPSHTDCLEKAPDLARFCAWVATRDGDDLLARDIGTLDVADTVGTSRASWRFAR